jgi:hypothetical protein
MLNDSRLDGLTAAGARCVSGSIYLTQGREASATPDFVFEAVRAFLGEGDARRFLDLKYSLQRGPSGLPNIGDDGFNVIELHRVNA